MNLNISRDTNLIISGLCFLILMGMMLLLVSPFWSELELYRSGLLMLSLGIGIGLLVLLVEWDERIKDCQQQNAHQRSMYKHFQRLKIGKK